MLNLFARATSYAISRDSLGATLDIEYSREMAKELRLEDWEDVQIWFEDTRSLINSGPISSDMTMFREEFHGWIESMPEIPMHSIHIGCDAEQIKKLQSIWPAGMLAGLRVSVLIDVTEPILLEGRNLRQLVSSPFIMLHAPA